MNTQYESHAENKPPPVRPSISTLSMSKLPGLLRIIGTAALLIAMYSFLLKGWSGGNDVIRYLLMLGHTGVLAIIGLASSHWLKENKGARLLLTLALVSIPANFAILGAFIFSKAGLESLVQYPDYVAWTVDSLQTAFLTSGGALIVLLPITLLGFTVLARSMSKRLTLLFLFSNAALLIPTRDPLLVGLIVLGLAVIGVLFTRQSSKQVAAKTREGLIALGLQTLPLAVLIGRTLWLYSIDLFLFSIMTITIYIILRQVSAYLDKKSAWRNVLDMLSLFPALIMIPLMVTSLVDANFSITALILPISALVSAAMIYDIARKNIQYALHYRWIAAIVLAIGVVLNMFVETGTLAAFISIIAGLGLFVLGYKNRQRGFFINGFILMIIGVVQQLYELVHHFDLGSWASMAVIGILTIVVASVIESKGGKIQQRFSLLKDNFRAWEG